MASGGESPVSHIRNHLKEILGFDSSNFFSDQLIQDYLIQYQGRVDKVECALESLIEQYYEHANKNMNNFVKNIGGAADSSVNFFKLPFTKRQSRRSGSGGSGSMGCGSSYDSRVHEQNQTSPSSAAINCDMCGTRFSFISRKRSCQDCGNVFCTTCLPRDRARQCERCGVLNKRPPHRGELMKLRVKDLQHFLTRKRINIKSCVEKKDLVELVLQHSQVSSPSDTNNSTHDDAGIRVSDQVPLERNRSFPQNYVESSHRHQWFQDKFGDEDQDDEDKEDVSETPVEPMSDVNNDDSTPVEPIPSNNDSDAEEDEVMSVVIGDSDSVAEDDRQDDDDVVEGAVGGEVESGHGKEDVTVEEEVPAPAAKRSFDHLNCDSNPGGAASLPNSPRRFANHGLVYLSEIQTEDDLNELSTKQIKDLLAMNRVNFKGCVEKEELLKILKRLWQQDQRNQQNADTMDDDSLCKICMDSPIDCVMLECGHMCTCTNCGKQMAECPICRQYVVRVVKTFKA